MIAVVDYGRGNLYSIAQALSHLGEPHEITADPARVAAADRILLPGVGAFGDAMAALTQRGLVEPLRRAAGNGVPLLGICLGMQMLVDESEEFGRHQGLGLIAGAVRRLPEGEGPDAHRLPNVGWRTLEPRADDGLLAGLPGKAMVYFVHSYAPRLADPAHVAATILFNGEHVPVIIRRGSILGFQFHPEKSGEIGLELIRRFLQMGRA